mmetsp:Transcript_35252/g.81701  ORF Transcript_35252/g.81701 Transcript_35252/m.81701 type:complete len:629 (+) Transcript_35252:41-1927(+)
MAETPDTRYGAVDGHMEADTPLMTPYSREAHDGVAHVERRRRWPLLMLVGGAAIAGTIAFGRRGSASDAATALDTKVPMASIPELEEAEHIEESDTLPDTRINKPHIVLMVGDDMGWNDIGYGSLDLKGASPNLDDLASQGVRLENFYSQHLCTPARASLMTGKYPVNIGMQHEEVITPQSPWGLNLTEKILPAFMKHNGYTTHAIGKWHLGHYTFPHMPTARGFDTFAGYLTDQIHYYNHTYPQMLAGTYFRDLISATTTAFHFYSDKSGILSDVLWREKLADVIGSMDTDGLGLNRHPLFLYFAAQTTHGPLDDIQDERLFTDNQKKVLKTIGNEERRRFAKLLMVMDKTTETIVDQLRDRNMWNNTLFVYTSDNGGCSKSGGYNNPLRGGKHFLFEGGIKVRAFVGGPALPEKARGTRYQGLMHISDLMPTILDVAGVEIPHGLDSSSHWKWLTGDRIHPASPRNEIIHNVDLWSFPTDVGLIEMDDGPRGALRWGDLKLITRMWPLGWYKPPLTDDDSDNEGIEDCNSAPDQYAVSDFLFNITADPEEKHNLYYIDALSEVRDAMMERLLSIAGNMSTPSWSLSDPDCVLYWKETGFISPWQGVYIDAEDRDNMWGKPSMLEEL